jgi:hypothetical protein
MAAIVNRRGNRAAAPRNASTNFIALTHPNFHLPHTAVD